MSNEKVFSKDSYNFQLKPGVKPPLEFALDNYLTFACRHKFCREVCPVYQATGNEGYIPYGFHTSLLALYKGIAKFEELGEMFVNCLYCGACQIRCPNTLFMGDFYKVTLTTIDLVRKIRGDLAKSGVVYLGLEDAKKEVENHLSTVDNKDVMLKWTSDLNLQIGGKKDIVLYVSRFMATQDTKTARLCAKLLQKAGVDFAVMPTTYAGISEPFDIGREDLFVQLAKQDIDMLKEMEAKIVITTDPHDYFYFKRDYPKIFGDLPFDIVFITEFLWRLIEDGKLKPVNEIKKKVAFHDPCTLNKLTGHWESPRKIISSIPGIEFINENHIDQWYYCCGNGVSITLKKAKPKLAQEIGLKRLIRVNDLGVSTLVLACPHCWDHFTEIETKTGIRIELINVIELLAKSVGV